MTADLISGPLAGQAFHFHPTDPSGERRARTMAADAGEKLKAAIEAAAGGEASDTRREAAVAFQDELLGLDT